ncbi:MAG TPA: rhomboid family intramembrane serine protease [Baekduia sp.]|nr:rhomboid family intramembrane serine protease [Baekduia sp.]
MAGPPDLFVVCKKCGSEVSPYITECPYCGTRLRKRAPKIDRRAGEAEPRAAKRTLRPSLSPLRTNEIPGIRGEAFGRPTATIVILALSLFMFVVLAFIPSGDVALNALSTDVWRYATASFAYPDVWYQLAVLLAIGIFGWRLEARHGPLVVIALYLVCGVGGDAIANAAGTDDLVFGAPGAAMGMLAAWALPDLLRARRGIDHDGDLLGTGVIFGVLALLPAVTWYASAVATFSGLALGLVAGALLLRTAAARA